MRAIHRYFEFPRSNRIAVGLGGGHSGYTVCVQHLLNANDTNQKVYVDTPRPESCSEFDSPVGPGRGSTANWRRASAA